MDNDIYNKIADYNDWYRLQRLAGGAAEMEKLKGEKMKNEIKEIKNRAISYKVYDRELHKANFTAKEILTIIAEIESLDKENQRYEMLVADNLQQLSGKEKEIKQLKQDYKDHTKVLGDKLNDQIEYGKQDKKKIEELGKRNEETEYQRHRCSQALDRANEKINKLQAVREAAEKENKSMKSLLDQTLDFLSKIPSGKATWEERQELVAAIKQGLDEIAAKDKDA